MSPEGSHISCDGAHAATIAVNGATKIRGVYMERMSERSNEALSIDVEKNGPNLLGSRIIAP